MRAILARKLGGADGLELVDDHPGPTTRAGHVVVALEAAALNFPDLLTLQGAYQHKQEPPYVPGMEGAGTVIVCRRGRLAKPDRRSCHVRRSGYVCRTRDCLRTRYHTHAEQLDVGAGCILSGRRQDGVSRPLSSCPLAARRVARRPRRRRRHGSHGRQTRQGARCKRYLQQREILAVARLSWNSARTS